MTLRKLCRYSGVHLVYYLVYFLCLCASLFSCRFVAHQNGSMCMDVALLEQRSCTATMRPRSFLWRSICIHCLLVFINPTLLLQMCILVNITCHIFFYSASREVGKLEYILSRCFLPNQLTAETPKLELMLWSSGPAFELYNKCLACLDRNGHINLLLLMWFWGVATAAL